MGAGGQNKPGDGIHATSQYADLLSIFSHIWPNQIKPRFSSISPHVNQLRGLDISSSILLSHRLYLLLCILILSNAVRKHTCSHHECSRKSEKMHLPACLPVLLSFSLSLSGCLSGI